MGDTQRLKDAGEQLAAALDMAERALRHNVISATPGAIDELTIATAKALSGWREAVKLTPSEKPCGLVFNGCAHRQICEGGCIHIPKPGPRPAYVLDDSDAGEPR